MTEADAAAGGGKKKEQPPLSKRQRRKHVNPSNTWPQQPKIQSPAARAKANLRVAGLLQTSNSSAARSLDPELDLHSPEVRFGRYLGAPEQRKRHLAVTSLQNYLKQRCDIHSTHGISELDLLKLWKGLWFTLYLADKVPVQEELSKRLAKLLWCVAGTDEEDEYAAQMYLDMCNQQEDEVVMEEIINTLDQDDEEIPDEEEQEVHDKESSESDESSSSGDAKLGEKNQKKSNESDENSSSGDDSVQDDEEDIPDELIEHCRGAHLAALFVKTFFRTIQREWGKMDKHRIDKFYTLVRLMMREIFSYMAARHWNRGIIFLFNDVIRDEVLFQVPNGLRCHLVDICLEELVNVNTKAPMPLTEATLLDCLDPYFALAQNSDDAMVHDRVVENIFGKFLNEYSVVSEKDSDKVLDQVHVGTIAEFLFNLGSDVDTQERYRKPLYDMYKKYMKRLKKVGKDVDLSMESSDGIDDAMEAEEEYAIHDSEEDTVKPNKRKRKDAKQGEDDTRDVEDSGSKMDQEKPHKKKRKKAKHESEPENESVLEQTPVERLADEPNETKKSKKKKKKQKVDMHEETVLEQAREEEVSNGEESAEKKKSKKKKKKKRKSSISSDDGSKGGMNEEVITITYSDQKKAADGIAKQDGRLLSSSKKKTSKKTATTPDTTRKSTEVTSEEKRVKWGFRNCSKSYKASMKALQTVKHTPDKTPEYGILRSKITTPGSTGSSKKKKKSRKKAKEYFF